MMSALLLILGLLFFAYATRHFKSGWLRKLGGLAVLGATYWAVFSLTGSVLGGIIAVIGWIFLPWLEILTRIRKLRLPMEKKLRNRFPPTHEQFPHLREFSSEIEAQGFEHIDDAGWDWQEMKQFIRIFYHPEKKLQATICMNEQSEMAFAYVALSSRTTDGKLWTTWNYPFSYTMKIQPDLVLNRAKKVDSFKELTHEHQRFLVDHAIKPESIAETEPDAIQKLLQDETQRQIEHNLKSGVITKTEEGTFRYSWRGMFFLWGQFLKDMATC